MPIYEYLCTKCEKRLEKLQKVSDQPLEICEHCQSSSLKRLISKAGFRLKGGGWYETDFKKSDDTKRNLASKKSESKNNTPKDDKKSEGAK